MDAADVTDRNILAREMLIASVRSGNRMTGGEALARATEFVSERSRVSLDDAVAQANQNAEARRGK